VEYIPRKSGKTGIESKTSAPGLCWRCWYVGWKHEYHIEKHRISVRGSGEDGLEVNTGNTNCMFIFRHQNLG